MTQSLWQVFTETGDPLCYLLYRADTREQTAAQDSRRESGTAIDRADVLSAAGTAARLP
jgi:hypothetical protein